MGPCGRSGLHTSSHASLRARWVLSERRQTTWRSMWCVEAEGRVRGRTEDQGGVAKRGGVCGPLRVSAIAEGTSDTLGMPPRPLADSALRLAASPSGAMADAHKCSGVLGRNGSLVLTVTLSAPPANAILAASTKTLVLRLERQGAPGRRGFGLRAP
eukprot:3873664-Prymnesium_polylepis.2